MKKMAERLTHREGKHTVRIGNEWRRHDPVWDKLAHYEDLEEQGRLIELPCALGDTVYDIAGIAGKGIRKQIVDGIEYMAEGFFIYANEDEWLGRFGDLVYLTKEEAEAKLKELRGVQE